MFQSEHTTQLAKRLQIMKTRTNRSYEALARRVGVSSSTLHRYCRGETVPPSFDVIARFGQACGANSQETTELLRCWALAVNGAPATDANRRSGRRFWWSVVLLGAGLAGGAAVRRRRTRSRVGIVGNR